MSQGSEDDFDFVDPFSGMFAGEAPTIPTDSLIDLPQAHRLFREIAWGQSEHLYGYQQPLAASSGPWVERGGRRLLMLSAYDYLGLIGHPAIMAGAIAAIERYGTGTGGVRLLTGTAGIHHELEQALADFLGVEAVATFNSGYDANLAVLSAVLGPGDVAMLDVRAHRSLLDGCRLAGVEIQHFSHNDVADLDVKLSRLSPGRRCLVVVDGVYSMDGDVCRLDALLSVAKRHRARVLVDDAHALGTLGPRGAGTASHFGIDPKEIDVITGSLNKSIPAGGGFVAGRRDLIVYLQHVAAPYMFSAALPPASAGAALAAIRVMEKEPERLARLRRNTEKLASGLRRLDIDIGTSQTPIIPVMAGSNEQAYRMSRRLVDAGIIAMPVIPPAVPRGRSLLRLCVTAAHGEDDIDFALTAFASLSSPVDG
ncbi:MAG: Glycine C-acetyltransferase [Proteobacteria bacterium]|jgi:8-amino-7-oxononanoate synthase|nr:Glycine C-acetyltransferase [Pseudomonadota bacterium]